MNMRSKEEIEKDIDDLVENTRAEYLAVWQTKKFNAQLLVTKEPSIENINYLESACEKIIRFRNDWTTHTLQEELKSIEPVEKPRPKNQWQFWRK